MSDLSARLGNAGRRMRPPWSPEHVEATVLGVRRKRTRFGARTAVLQGVALLVAASSAAALVANVVPFKAPTSEVGVAEPPGPPVAPHAARAPTSLSPSIESEPVEAPGPIVNDAPMTSPQASAPAPRAARAPGFPAWRELANRGAYDEAYDALQRQGGPKDDVNDLLLAADVARLGHHPREAEAPLRQIVDEHAADSRASLAAFTLGRVLLETLAQPEASADAFARARSLSPHGALAEDALAREVEARSRAGQSAAAHTLALDYVTRFPDGARLRSVRQLGGLE